MSKARWTLSDGKGAARGYALKKDAEAVRLRELALGNTLILDPGAPPKDSRLLRV